MPEAKTNAEAKTHDESPTTSTDLTPTEEGHTGPRTDTLDDPP